MKKPGLKKKPPFVAGLDWRTSSRDSRFDELVVDDWFHMEHMRDNTWWMRVGDANFNIVVGQDGRAQIFNSNGEEIKR